MKGPGAITLAVVFLCAPLAATARPTRGTSNEQRQVLKEVASPDGRHTAALTRRGRVMLDGRTVRSGPGQALAGPVWRRDSRALAFLQRTANGMQLVVVPGLDAAAPLVWLLPSTAATLRKVFWISSRQLGVGHNEVVPKLVVSWTTTQYLW